MTKRFSKLTYMSLVLAVFWLGEAMAARNLMQGPKSLGKFGDWEAFEMKEKEGKVCYMLSHVKESEGKYSKRGDVYALITHRPALKSKNVVSLHAGYAFGEGQQVKVTVKGPKGFKNFHFFTQGETAWCSDPKTDTQVTQYLTQNGAQMIVEGKSAKGTVTKDIYSLSGALKTYKIICKACGVPAESMGKGSH